MKHEKNEYYWSDALSGAIKAICSLVVLVACGTGLFVAATGATEKWVAYISAMSLTGFVGAFFAAVLVCIILTPAVAFLLMKMYGTSLEKQNT